MLLNNSMAKRNRSQNTRLIDCSLTNTHGLHIKGRLFGKVTNLCYWVGLCGPNNSCNIVSYPRQDNYEHIKKIVQENNEMYK